MSNIIDIIFYINYILNNKNQWEFDDPPTKGWMMQRMFDDVGLASN